MLDHVACRLHARRDPCGRRRRDDRRLLGLRAGGPVRQRDPDHVLDGPLDEHGRALHGRGAREGIVTHSSMVDVMHNRVSTRRSAASCSARCRWTRASATRWRAPRHRDHLHGSLDVRDRAQHDRRREGRRGRTTRRAGVAIEAYFYAEAQVPPQHRAREPGRRPGIRQLDDQPDAVQSAGRRASSSSHAPVTRASSTFRGTRRSRSGRRRGS